MQTHRFIQLTTVLVCSLVVGITMPTHTTASIAPPSVSSVEPYGCPRPGQECTQVYLPLVSRPLERQVGPFEYVSSYIQSDTFGVEISGSVAYVTGNNITDDTGTSLLAVDISDPANPARLTVPNYILMPTGAQLVRPYLYGIHTRQGRGGVIETDFQIVDVRDPISPTVTAKFTTNAIYGFDIVDGHAYAVGDFGHLFGTLEIYDVRNPDAPVTIIAQRFSDDVLGSSVRVRDGFAFVGGISKAGRQAVLMILDVSNPDHIRYRSEFYFQVLDSVRSLELATNVAYLATGSGGVQVVDISRINGPEHVGSYDTPGSARELFLDGTLLYVADGAEGLQILDVSDPTAPQFVASYTANGIGEVRDVEVVDDLIYLATSNGLHILRYRPD